MHTNTVKPLCGMIDFTLDVVADSRKKCKTCARGMFFVEKIALRHNGQCDDALGTKGEATKPCILHRGLDLEAEHEVGEGEVKLAQLHLRLRAPEERLAIGGLMHTESRKKRPETCVLQNRSSMCERPRPRSTSSSTT